jgi:hypothetical protein
MDYSKLTKQELIESINQIQLLHNQQLTEKDQDIHSKIIEIKELSKKISQLENSRVDVNGYDKKIQDLEALKQQAFNNEHTVRTEMRQKDEKYKNDLQKKEEQIVLLNIENKNLKAYVDSIANLFDEVVKAFTDQNQLLHTFDRNVSYVENYLLSKISKFNNAGEDSKQENKKQGE